MRPLLVVMVVKSSLRSLFMWLSRYLLLWALLLPATHARIARHQNLKTSMLAAARLLAPIRHLAALHSGVSAALLSVQYVGMTPSGHFTIQMLYCAWAQFALQVGGKFLALDSLYI